MARPPKMMKLSTRKVSKAEREARENEESALKVDTSHLREPPDWLDDIGKAEFLRVAESAAEINILDNLDLAVLAIYANSYSQYIKAVDLLKGEFDIKWMNIQEKNAKLILQCSTKLGLAATDRLKLVVPHFQDEKPVNKFLQFVK